MAIVVESTTTANFATGSTTFTQNKPSGTVDDDFLFAVVISGADNNTTELTVTGVPSGWTLVESTLQTISGGSNNPVWIYTYYKVASSEGASWNWTLSTSGSEFFYGGAVMRISGANQVSSSDENTVDNDDTPSFSSGVTPIGASSLLIMVSTATDGPAAGLSSASYAITTSDPTWTELFDDNAGEGAGASFHGSIAYAIRTEATATGNWTLTYSGGSGVADTASQLHTIPPVVNVTVTPTVDTATFTVQDPSITGDANVTAGVLTATWALPAPTITTPNPTWNYQTKNQTTSSYQIKN